MSQEIQFLEIVKEFEQQSVALLEEVIRRIIREDDVSKFKIQLHISPSDGSSDSPSDMLDSFSKFVGGDKLLDFGKQLWINGEYIGTLHMKMVKLIFNHVVAKAFFDYDINLKEELLERLRTPISQEIRKEQDRQAIHLILEDSK